MRLKLSTLIIFSLFTFQMSAQDVMVSFQSGAGFYDMGSLKSINQTKLAALPFDAQLVSNFPAYIYYKPMLKVCSSMLDFGLVYTISSTGSRISSADYSGNYHYDTKIQNQCMGLFANKNVAQYKNVKLAVGIECGVSFSKIKTEESLQLTAFEQTTNNSYASSAGYVQPGIMASVPYNDFSFELNVSYYKEFLRGDYTQNENSANSIVVNNKVDMWDGARVGITVSYLIFKKH